MKLEFYRKIFKKSSSIKFIQNLSSESRIVLSGRMDRHMTTLIVTFRNFANAPKNFGQKEDNAAARHFVTDGPLEPPAYTPDLALVDGHVFQH
jgi:hypothetical protein